MNHLSKKVLPLLVTLISLAGAEDRINPSEACSGSDDIFVGIDFNASGKIPFSTEYDEWEEWNEILMKYLSKVTGRHYRLVFPNDLGALQDCTHPKVFAEVVDYAEEPAQNENISTITITITSADSGTSSSNKKIFTLHGRGDNAFGHSRPLQNAIKEAAQSFEIRERGERRLRGGFSPLFTMGFPSKGPIEGIMGEMGFTYSTHYWGGSISYADDLGGDTYFMLGAALTYGYAIYQTPLFRLSPKLDAGWWYLSERTFYPQTTSIAHWGYKYYQYYAAPGIDMKIGNGRPWGSVWAGCMLGDGPPLFKVRFGLTFFTR